jgi:ABC-type transport system substrate-binding protein
MIQEAPGSLDPPDSASVYESLPLNQIFDTLVTLDPSLNLVPALAESWTISKDNLTYTFQLRTGVHFHDGTPLTVDDVIFTFERVLRPGGDFPSLAHSYLMVIDGAPEFAERTRDEITGLESLDAGRLRIRLTHPYTSFLEVLAMDGLSVVPQKALESMGDEEFGRAPVGTGPFRLAYWDADRLRLVRNKEYFGEPPLLEAVEITFLGQDEDDFGAKRFFDRQLDMFEPATEFVPMLEADEQVNLYRYQELSLSFLGLNRRQPPLDKQWLRQAIAHAIDRERLVADNPSVRREAVGILPPGIWGYSPEVKALEYSPDRARRLLADAGHAGGEGLPPIRLYSPSMGKAVQRVIEQMRKDLKAVGLELEVVEVTWVELGEALDDGTVPAFLLAWIADLTDPDSFLRSMFESGGSGNYFAHENAATDELLQRGVQELNPVERARIYRELERQILTDAPLVPLYHTLGMVAMRSSVQGLKPGPMGLSRLELEKVWLSRGEDAS